MRLIISSFSKILLATPLPPKHPRGHGHGNCPGLHALLQVQWLVTDDMRAGAWIDRRARAPTVHPPFYSRPCASGFSAYVLKTPMCSAALFPLDVILNRFSAGEVARSLAVFVIRIRFPTIKVNRDAQLLRVTPSSSPPLPECVVP